jgi:hypothetical protein
MTAVRWQFIDNANIFILAKASLARSQAYRACGLFDLYKHVLNMLDMHVN